MTTFVGFLRGINVGSHHRVSMSDLRDALAAAGFPDATTYLQSGNVLVKSPASAKAVATAIRDAMRAGWDVDAEVAVRSASQLGKVLEANPFAARGVDTSSLHVGFLGGRPSADAARTLRDASFGADEFALRGTELYLRYPNGLGRSKMTGAFFERALGVPLTVRRGTVVAKLEELATT